jgi:ankyrin repeat protein
MMDGYNIKVNKLSDMLSRIIELSGLTEEIENIEKGIINKEEVIIPADYPLYHGTIESFDVRNIRTGGYDDILWTSTSKKIARYYIPDARSSVLNVTLKYLASSLIEKEDPWYSVAKNQLGISDNIKEKLIEKGFIGHERLYNKYTEIERLKKNYYKLEKLERKEKDIEKIRKYMDELLEIAKEWEKAEEEYKKLPRIDYNTYLEKYIELKMKKLFGYEAEGKDRDKRYKKLKVELSSDTLKKADDSDKGKLVVIRPKRDLVFYNYTYKRSEGDLMDVDYKKFEIFELVKEKKDEDGKYKYDGIIIHDFAQSNKWGNYGHLSYGLFQRTIKDCKISSMQKQTHPINEGFARNYKSWSTFQQCCADGTAIQLQNEIRDLDDIEEIEKRDANGYTPLMIVCNYNSDLRASEKAEILIDEGVEIDVQNDADFNFTALHYSCYNGEIDLALTLLEKGANPDLETTNGEKPIDLFDEEYSRKIFKDRLKVMKLNKILNDSEPIEKGLEESYFTKKQKKNFYKSLGMETNFRKACAFGSPKRLKIEISKLENIEEEINRKGIEDSTPMMLVCSSEDNEHWAIEKVKILLKNGANINEKDDKDGFTPLHCACSNDRPQLAAFLIAHGADEEALSDYGKPEDMFCELPEEERKRIPITVKQIKLEKLLDEEITRMKELSGV